MIIGQITSENVIWACIVCVSILSLISLFMCVRILIKFDDFKLAMLDYMQSVGTERINIMKRLDKIERKAVRRQHEERQKD